jgi:hypothetical protein
MALETHGKHRQPTKGLNGTSVTMLGMPQSSCCIQNVPPLVTFDQRQHIGASMIRNKFFVAKAINFFFDVYDSRFEVGNHRITNKPMRERRLDFLLEDFLSLLEDRYVGLQHEALRLS